MSARIEKTNSFMMLAAPQNLRMFSDFQGFQGTNGITVLKTPEISNELFGVLRFLKVSPVSSDTKGSPRSQ
jgi:hypothetical protein